MAIVRLSPIIGGISGTLAGLTFTNTRAGLVVRSRPSRTSRTSTAVIAQRNQFRSLRLAWRDLTPAERAAWNTLAQVARIPNALAVPRALSGFALFIQQNQFRLAAGVSIESEPPAAIQTPAPTMLTVSASESGVVYVTPAGQDGTVNFFGTYTGARPRRSPPVSHFGYPRVLGTFFGPFNVGSTIDTIWDPLFGHPQQGEIIQVGLRLLEPGKLPSRIVTGTAVTTA